MAANSRRILFHFFSGWGPDYNGRMLEEILGWSDQHLEDCHDYIQTLFPLPEPSGYNVNVPLIDTYVFKVFRNSPELQVALLRSFERILKFYGMQLVEEEINDESGNRFVKTVRHAHL